jgi:hypothetical protein
LALVANGILVASAQREIIRMKKRLREGKGGRGTSARKAPGAGCTCSPPSKKLASPIQSRQLPSSVPPFAEIFQELAIERQNLMEALRYTLREYDRAVGTHPDQSGWTAEDILRLEKIREIAKP